MSRDPVTIGLGISPVAAARLMVKHDVGRLPVVEDDRLIGIVTRSDVMTYFYDLMPD
jgi:CBS domain-containing protein